MNCLTLQLVSSIFWILTLWLTWWLKQYRICLECGRSGFNPSVKMIPWKRNGYPLQYSCLRIPWTEQPGRLQSRGSQSVGHNWATILLDSPAHSCIIVVSAYFPLLDFLAEEAPGCSGGTDMLSLEWLLVIW